jgi:5-methylcytosine-specific restriction enzyme A
MASVLQELRPEKKLLVMHLLQAAGFDVSSWAKYKGKHATSNPKSYNWSFEQAGEKFALCLWYPDIKTKGGETQHRLIPASRGAKRKGPGSANWNKRAADMLTHARTAYEQQLPIRVIVVDGKQRNPSDAVPVASRVKARLLDPVPWAVKEFNFDTGEWLLVRGLKPVVPAFSAPDIELSYYEGTQRLRFILHRRREGELRRAKIAEVLARDGKLVCEVPNCDFDFKERYSLLGEGYAQVHHLIPLKKAPPEGRKIFLKDLAVVCANCHVMIHRNGECRPLEGLLSA